MLLPLLKKDDNLPELLNYTYSNKIFEKYGEIFVSNLSQKRIIKAYQNGIFPYYQSNLLDDLKGFTNELKDSTVWCFPKNRFILNPKKFIEKVQSNRIFKKSIKNYNCKLNSDFEEILIGCMNMKRTQSDKTWMTNQLIDQYIELNKLGYTYSIGAYKEDKLCGGLFGIGIGNMYCGNSMFRNTKAFGEKFTQNSSKAALTHLAKMLSEVDGIIDCQFHSNFFEQVGGEYVSNNQFLELIYKNRNGRTFKPNNLINSK